MNTTRFQQVERACADLVQGGKPVTFTAIADATGIARSTLYRNRDLRAVVEQQQHNTPGPIAVISDEIAILRSTVTALATKVRDHEEQLRRITRTR